MLNKKTGFFVLFGLVSAANAFAKNCDCTVYVSRNNSVLTLKASPNYIASYGLMNVTAPNECAVHCSDHVGTYSIGQVCELALNAGILPANQTSAVSVYGVSKVVGGGPDNPRTLQSHSKNCSVPSVAVANGSAAGSNDGGVAAGSNVAPGVAMAANGCVANVIDGHNYPAFQTSTEFRGSLHEDFNVSGSSEQSFKDVCASKLQDFLRRKCQLFREKKFITSTKTINASTHYAYQKTNLSDSASWKEANKSSILCNILADQGSNSGKVTPVRKASNSDAVKVKNLPSQGLKQIAPAGEAKDILQQKKPRQ